MGDSDNRRGIKFAVQDDGQALINIFPRNLAESLGPFGIKGKTNFRFAHVSRAYHRGFDAARHFRLVLLDHVSFRTSRPSRWRSFALQDLIARLGSPCAEFLFAVRMNESKFEKGSFLNGGFFALS